MNIQLILLRYLYSAIFVIFVAGSSLFLDLDTSAQIIKAEANPTSSSNMSTTVPITAPPLSEQNIPEYKIYLISGIHGNNQKILGKFTVINTRKGKLSKSDLIDFNLNVDYDNNIIKCGLKELTEFTSNSSDYYRREPFEDSPDILLKCQNNNSKFSLNGKTSEGEYTYTTKSIKSSRSINTNSRLPTVDFKYDHSTVTVNHKNKIYMLNIEHQP